MRWRWVIAGVLVLAAGGAAGLAHIAYKPIALTAQVPVTIADGETTGDIADRLDSLGLLRSRRLFVWWARLRRVDRDLQPGRYLFSGSTSMDDILDILRFGVRETVSVTIPEGWTIPETIARLSTSLDIPRDALEEVLRDSDFPDRTGIPYNHMEGYLLPETYEFFAGVGAGNVIKRLISESEAIFEDSITNRLAELDMTRHQILTLASMIEAETGVRNERALIAGVFHNRLRRGMLLQCDPTVIYAMGGLRPGRRLYTKDLEIESPYNTYRNSGLPPGPICNPGRAAIMAALYPDTTDALYFVADGNGGHIFSRTLNEHNRARVRVKRGRGR